MNLAFKMTTLLPALLAASAAQAGVTGNHYTNFGADLVTPIFPVDGTLSVYRNKGDAKPIAVIKDKPIVQLDEGAKACMQKPADGWVRCSVSVHTGWVRRDTFHTGAEVTPPPSWPFRYWLYVAGSGMGGEETDALLKIVPKVPYLVTPKEFENVFFQVRFDEEGNAISPRTGKPTGDRAFVVDSAAYLAPADPARRNGATWLFLGYFNEKHNALCPGREAGSCLSAVNTAPGWTGIKALYTEPAKQFLRKDGDGPWFGAGEVAFARHADPVQPLMYRVPDDVHMRIDGNGLTDAQRAKNRAKLFCVADCGSVEGTAAKR